MNLLKHLQGLLHEALKGLTAEPALFSALVKPVQDARIKGDYQANCAMSLAKQLGQKPPDVARQILEALPANDAIDHCEIAGPGFINITLKPDWLAARLQEMASDERLCVEKAIKPLVYVIDYSSPNVAKPMHVGHLRSTIIGDALARLLRFLGHKVIADNHLGDWGAQMGMIIWGWKNHRDEDAYRADAVGELARLYRLTGSMTRDGVEGVEKAAQQETAKLHAGDAENRALWKEFMPHCLAGLQSIYDRLDIHFDEYLGESAYDDMLPAVIDSLKAKGLAVESQGALVVEVPGLQAPFMVRKSDGAFNYATTDLATIRYRHEHFYPDVLLYVVDHRQGDHFKALFDVARRWGYDRVAMEHVGFGTIMGKDKKPFKAREGDVVGLESVLDEGVSRARAVVDANSPDLSPEERGQIAEIVGLGAIKYVDLSQNRTSDYIFDWDKMLAMDGNTATYMQYAYARNCGIMRKGNVDPAEFRKSPPKVILGTAHERALAVQLLRFQEALEAAAAEYKPNLITAYLWEVARAYSGFFVNCPVFKEPVPPPAVQQSRILLCDLTARVIRQGLALLGICTAERM
jgi:arginyl-tRNA synthetase